MPFADNMILLIVLQFMKIYLMSYDLAIIGKFAAKLGNGQYDIFTELTPCHAHAD